MDGHRSILEYRTRLIGLLALFAIVSFYKIVAQRSLGSAGFLGLLISLSLLEGSATAAYFYFGVEEVCLIQDSQPSPGKFHRTRPCSE